MVCLFYYKKDRLLPMSFKKNSSVYSNEKHCVFKRHMALQDKEIRALHTKKPHII